MEAALVGEGPPPHCLRKYMLAAGVGEVGGLGATAIYGHRVLTLREFEEAWMIQQTILRLQADSANSESDGPETPDAPPRTRQSLAADIRSRTSVKKTLKLERDGALARYEDDPASVMPAWMPRDPGPM